MQSNIDITKGMSFDSSLLNIDGLVSKEEYQNRLTSLLQSILIQQFPGNIGKQKIRVYRDRISFACPICGDSMKSNYKKRGNFILKGRFANFFKCHNCGKSLRIDSFFERFKVSLDLSIINYISKGMHDFSTHADEKYDMSLFLDMKSLEQIAIDRHEFMKSFGLIEVKDSKIWQWLKNRLQHDQSKFLYNPTHDYLVILNLTPGGKILGAQKRTFSGHNKYLTYTLSKLYELLNKDTKLIPEEVDTISQIFNICLINYAKNITLFEGPLDSFLFKNSIASTGIHKNLKIDLPIRYWYDDDKDGKQKSIEKINNGESVFLWNKFKVEFNLPNRPKWDLNDVVIWFKLNKISLPNFNIYFSKDQMDIIDI